MDELLHTGHEEAQESGLSLAPLRARLTGGADALCARLAPLRHKLDAATAGGRRVVNPLHLLAAAAVLGVAAVVGPQLRGVAGRRAPGHRHRPR